MVERSRKRTAKRLSLADHPSAVGLVLCMCGAILHSIQLYREILRFDQMMKSAVLVDRSPFFARLHGLLVLAFFICVVGILLRSRPGLILSISSLIFVLLIYAHWYEFSYRDLKLIRESGYVGIPVEVIPPHPLGLVSASWLDIGILFAVVIVLAWQVKFLISTFRHHNESR
jgi:hypothetical protein